MKSLSVEIESSRKNISHVEQMLHEVNIEFKMNDEKFRNLLTAVSELVLNAIIHGNKEVSSRKIKVSADYDDKELIVRVLDEGFGFDIEKIPDPTLPENIQNSSGRGLYIVKQLVDKFEYKKTPEGALIILNVLK